LANLFAVEIRKISIEMDSAFLVLDCAEEGDQGNRYDFCGRVGSKRGSEGGRGAGEHGGVVGETCELKVIGHYFFIFWLNFLGIFFNFFIF
jgi:hypothetical protein